MLVEYKDVVLLRDVEKGNPAYGGVEFRCGDIGVLVDLLDGYEAAIVEFIAGPGHTLDVTPLTQADVRHLEPDEIQSLRVVNLDDGDAPDEELLAYRNVLRPYSHVALTRPIPELALLPGDLGMVVECRPEAGEYTIRMSVGHDVAVRPVITLPAEALRVPEWYELPAVRKLQPVAPAPAAAHTAG